MNKCTGRYAILDKLAGT